MNEQPTAGHEVGQSAARNLPAITTAAVIVGLVWGLIAYSSTPAIAPTDQTGPSVRERCAAEQASITANYNDLMLQGDYVGAELAVRACGQASWPDNTWRDMRERAEHHTTVRNPKNHPFARQYAMLRLDKLDPTGAAKLATMRRDIDRLAEEIRQTNAAEARAAQIRQKAIDAAESKVKKSQGVHIGMSAQDVLDSSWGRPRTINRSVYSFGTREQWVYGDGNYLYFSDGVLTSVTTSR